MAQEMVPKVALMTPVEYVCGLSWRPPQSGNAFLDRYILVCRCVFFLLRFRHCHNYVEKDMGILTYKLEAKSAASRIRRSES